MDSLYSTLKLGILYAVLTTLLVCVGYFVGGLRTIPLFLGIAILMNAISYWFSDRIALSMAGARPLVEKDAPFVLEDIRSLSSKMGIPVPNVYISEQAQPNAFATGRDPGHAVICVTRGLINTLEREEIKGVLAHELSHIKHRDVLLITVAAVMAGAISSFAYVGSRVLVRDEHGSKGSGGVLLLILSPFIALLLQLAISRSREYAADDGSAEATGNPRFLADALLKIHESTALIPLDVNPALSSLYIDNPFPGGLLELFSTHPNFEQRIKRLMEREPNV